ncbi:methyltransferase domain-containing protein [Acinetobacter sp. NEB149]|jgi:predicted O-methyltransferase YrrM|uniref:O-methyltransferase n=1 Tax=Acinetobacter TaxID=469 RepID=UPI00110D0CE7|nr:MULTISPECIES: class I SAM-dependent methyltransferase [Acinetobacter]QJB48927.1 methyltransferase domain-containing protein [Acinetobacter sp. NEB149]TMS56338.1 methyltransferase domain-containing protein [Acinetobacter lwoffii]
MQNSDEFERFMQELYEKFHRHDLKQADRLHRYRNIEPESGRFLSMLIRAQQSKNILEIGTSTGYSTLWLAEAARQTQAMITTLEVDAERVAQAKQYATEIDLADLINFKVIDAQVYLKEEQEIFDFILLDAERDAYVSYWPHLSRLLKAKGGLLVVDNVISHAAEVEEFIALIQQDPRFIMSTVPIGAGLLMVGFR